MIQKLQMKFILIAMSASILVTCSIFGIILFNNYKTIDRQNEGILNMISNNDGNIPEYKPRNDYLADVITKETKYTTRYFYMKLDDEGNITETNLQYIASISTNDAENILAKILERGKETGYYDNYKYKIIKKDYGKLVVFLDCSIYINNLKSTTQRAVLIISIGLTIVFIIISVLSKKVLTPLIKNIEAQKQFVTNAGHELKTPVAVILANIDVLELKMSEENEWLKSTKKQAKRLDSLIKSMLNLAKVEEGNSKINYTEFSLTDLLKEEINDFKSLAKNKKFIFDENKDVSISADYNSISQLVDIFLDNALKYTPENGTIKIVAEKFNKNTKLQFMNDCENVNEINTKKLFDRFYREDKARTPKKEGYGIGLSIAKSIVELHKGKISASITDEKMICFTIII